MTIDIDALQEAAEKARGWEWETAQGNEFGHLNEDGCFYEIGSVDADQYSDNDEPHNETVLNFITRANPAAIEYLIERLRTAEARIATFENSLDMATARLAMMHGYLTRFAPDQDDAFEAEWAEKRAELWAAHADRAAPEGRKEGGE